MGSRVWPFGVTWRHWSRDHWTPGSRLPMGGPWWPCVYLAPLWRYGASNIMGSRVWPFDHSTPGGRLSIRGPWWPCVYLAPLRRYSASKIMGSWVWPFGVTWRYRSRDHSTPRGRVLMGGPWWPCIYLAPLQRYGASKVMGVTSLTFWGHVTSLVTWPFDSRESTSYPWSMVTMRLSGTVTEI